MLTELKNLYRYETLWSVLSKQNIKNVHPNKRIKFIAAHLTCSPSIPNLP